MALARALKRLNVFVSSHAALTKPDKIVICDGSSREWRELTSSLVASGAIQAVPARKNCFLARAPPEDVARVEKATFICSPTKAGAGLLNNWAEPSAMHARVRELFAGSARGRTLFAVPFRMGPPGAPGAKLAVQLTDSPYVVLNTHIMAAVAPLEELVPTVPDAAASDFVELRHSVGVPLEPGEADVPWPCRPKDVVVAHFPATKDVWSFGSGFGGNSLLGKKCLSLRLGSVIAKEEGWCSLNTNPNTPTVRINPDPNHPNTSKTQQMPSTCASSASSAPTVRNSTSPRRFRARAARRRSRR